MYSAEKTEAAQEVFTEKAINKEAAPSVNVVVSNGAMKTAVAGIASAR